MSGWEFDEKKTQQRYQALQEYYHDQRLNADGFACKYWSACSDSAKLSSQELGSVDISA